MLEIEDRTEIILRSGCHVGPAHRQRTQNDVAKRQLSPRAVAQPPYTNLDTVTSHLIEREADVDAVNARPYDEAARIAAMVAPYIHPPLSCSAITVRPRPSEMSDDELQAFRKAAPTASCKAGSDICTMSSAHDVTPTC